MSPTRPTSRLDPHQALLPTPAPHLPHSATAMREGGGGDAAGMHACERGRARHLSACTAVAASAQPSAPPCPSPPPPPQPSPRRAAMGGVGTRWGERRGEPLGSRDGGDRLAREWPCARPREGAQVRRPPMASPMRATTSSTRYRHGEWSQAGYRQHVMGRGRARETSVSRSPVPRRPRR